MTTTASGLDSIVGLALLICGAHRVRSPPGPRLPGDLVGLLPESRAARPAACNILAAFQGFGLTYTSQGIRFDRLTATQRRILALLRIPLPRPEQHAA